MYRKFAFTAFTALLTVATVPARAESITRQVKVQYADLDLRRTADVRELDRRLRAAIGAVCSDEDATDRDKQHCRFGALRRMRGQRDAAISSAKNEARLALNASTR
jgi:UrcA family protein